MIIVHYSGAVVHVQQKPFSVEGPTEAARSIRQLLNQKMIAVIPLATRRTSALDSDVTFLPVRARDAPEGQLATYLEHQLGSDKVSLE